MEVSDEEDDEEGVHGRTRRPKKIKIVKDNQMVRNSDLNLTSSSRSLVGIRESHESMSLSDSKNNDNVASIASPASTKRHKRKPLKLNQNKQGISQKFQILNSPTNMSYQTEAINSDRYAEEADEHSGAQPKIKGFNNRDIVVNSSAQQDWKMKNTESSVQTDTEMFFLYMFQFISELENRINSGELSIDDILAMGRLAIGEKHAKENAAAGGSASWAYESPDKSTKQQMFFTIQELRDCLARIRSLSAHGGDIFFAGIARTMVT